MPTYLNAIGQCSHPTLWQLVTPLGIGCRICGQFVKPLASKEGE